MSEDITPSKAKPEGGGLFNYDDVDTRMGYKAIDKDPSASGQPKVKVSRHRNRQREVKIGRK
jgi:hypothetical protein